MNNPDDTVVMHVTPRRLGEMYANTIINLVDTLQNGHFELAQKARRAPEEILSSVPSLQPGGLLDFIAGVATQCENLLDMLAEDTDTPYPGISTNTDTAASDLQDSLAGEINGLHAQIDEALELTRTPATATRGFVDLATAGSDLTLLRARRNLGPDNFAHLDALEKRIDTALRNTSRKNLIRYISGQRHAQLFRATRGN